MDHGGLDGKFLAGDAGNGPRLPSNFTVFLQRHLLGKGVSALGRQVPAGFGGISAPFEMEEEELAESDLRC